MKRLETFTGIIVFLAATLSHAAVPYAFPDQPGALSADEIQAATDAVKPMLGTGPALELVASGKRSPGHPMPSYALFAAPLVDYSDRVKVRKQVVCNQWREAQQWRCGTLYDEFRMSANGMEHAFSHQVTHGAGDRQGAVDVVDFMYSRCFGAQFAAIGGKPFTPSADSDFASGILDDGKGFTVVTGPLRDNASYRLEKTDKSKDGCGFRILGVRQSGVVFPESYAKEIEKQAEKARVDSAAREQADRLARDATMRKEEAERRLQNSLKIGPWYVDKSEAAAWEMMGCVLFALLAFAVPWFALARGSRWAAAGTAAGLMAVSTALGVLVIRYEPVYFLFVVWPMAQASFAAIGFVVWAAVRELRTSLGAAWILWISGMVMVIMLLSAALFLYNP